MSEKEYRSIPIEDAELRMEKENGETKIRGYAALFNVLSQDFGGWRERILPGSFPANLGDVHSYYNHEPNYILGRRSSKTLDVWIDDRGLGYSVNPPKSRADVMEAIERGDVKGSSFAFVIAKDGAGWATDARGNPVYDERGKPIYEIRKISKLHEVGPVVNPAYPDTTAAKRSLHQVQAIQVPVAIGMTLGDAARRIRFLELSAEHRS